MLFDQIHPTVLRARRSFAWALHLHAVVSVRGKSGSFGSHPMLVQDIEIEFMEKGQILLRGIS